MAYIITISCDPYNAKWNYHYETVLKRNGLTPVLWMANEEVYETEEEALKEFQHLADIVFDTDNYIYEDDESIKDNEDESKDEWYKGEGYYFCYGYDRAYAPGEWSFSKDTLTYEVREIAIL